MALKRTKSKWRIVAKVFLWLFAFVIVVIGAGAGAAYHYINKLKKTLPDITAVHDYKPRRVTEVYARGGEKIGEFFREVRMPVPYEQIPEIVIKAFTAAEDSKFFEHKGLDYQAILRAAKANYEAGRTVQGGSTITQQVAKSFFLTPEKKMERKIKEALLALEIEKKLSKEKILYLYLNQIFFGNQSYGVAGAAHTYFRKSLDQLTIAEAALIAGLPQAPTRYSPTRNPNLAKARQRHVLARMLETKAITKPEYDKAIEEPIQIFFERETKMTAPYFVETVRQLLVEEMGEAAVLDGGIKVYTSLDLPQQLDAEKKLHNGLKALDRRLGYRGALRRITNRADALALLMDTRRKLETEANPGRLLLPNGNFAPERPLAMYRQKAPNGTVITNLPPYIKIGASVEALVTEVDDINGVVKVRFAECQGMMDIRDMGWARKPDIKVWSERAPKVTRPSSIVKTGDVVLVNVKAPKFPAPRWEDYAYVTLDQDPEVEGSILTLEQKSQDIVAMVGGYDFERSKFNRALQAQRQTGSSFKPIIYLAALDKGWTGARTIPDAPIVMKFDKSLNKGDEKWKPKNHTNTFEGDVLMRRALAESMNVPTVKILENIGIRWTVDYARRLGIFSPLAEDLSLSLGSSGITLYEMTKVFSLIGRLGKRARPVVIHKVTDPDGMELRKAMSLDRRYAKELFAIEKPFDDVRREYGLRPAYPNNRAVASVNAAPLSLRDRNKFYFANPDQVIRPTSAYLITDLLKATIYDENGTGARARALGRPVAGKTGTTDSSYDTWFMGFTTAYASGVWIGYDQEKTLGIGEAGNKTALPIWVEHMKALHTKVPPSDFIVPEGIVFAKIDKKTGKLAAPRSKNAIKQAFLKGTEPKEMSDSKIITNAPDFFKEDFAY